MNLIIAGSRDFNDFKQLERETLLFLKANKQRGEELHIISGRARGADKLGEKFAEKYNTPVIKLPADWEKHGKAAGHIRNKEMAKIASHCIIFWNRSSLGARNMLKIAKEKNLITKLNINEDYRFNREKIW